MSKQNKLSQDQLKRALRLYAISDSACLNGHTLESCTREIIAGGATMFQYRNKRASRDDKCATLDNKDCVKDDHPEDAALNEALTLQQICKEYGVPFIVNDNVNLASKIGADGVHVGQDDMPCAQVRELLGDSAIVGVSVQTLPQAIKAQECGASYLGVGAIVPTPTKPDAALVLMEDLRKIASSLNIPVVAIGGINENNVSIFQGSGIAGVAVVSALFGSSQPKRAAANLLSEIEKYL